MRRTFVQRAVLAGGSVLVGVNASTQALVSDASRPYAFSMTQIVIQDGELERLIDVPEATETIVWNDRRWRRHGDYYALRSFIGKDSASYALPNKPADMPYYVADQ